jgi:hypothetical protein
MSVSAIEYVRLLTLEAASHVIVVDMAQRLGRGHALYDIGQRATGGKMGILKPSKQFGSKSDSGTRTRFCGF